MQSCFGPFTFTPKGTGNAICAPPRLLVFQDLNPYFIKQIARSLQEFDLEQKIELEIKMREGTTKLLAACHHPSQSIEAAKTLLVSNERMTVYLGELQKRKLDANQNTDIILNPEPCKAKVSVTDIRMPLIWKDSDHFKNKGDYRRFAVFCILKIGTEIYDTAMISRVDRSMTDISFDDIVVFNQVPHDFEFQLEIYGHILQDDLSIASTPHKIKHRINDSLSRKVGRKLAASLKEELAAMDSGPRFELMARATLTLNEVDDNIRTHDLTVENIDNPLNQLPLFGHFCCRLAAQPDVFTIEGMSGYLNVKKATEECHRQWWGGLKGFQLSFWASVKNAQNGSDPEFCIAVSKDTTIDMNATDDDEHFAIHIKNSRGNLEVSYGIFANDVEETKTWLRELRSTAHSHAKWKHAAETAMEIQSPVVRRLPLFSRFRKGSLYEQTPLKADSSSPCIPQYDTKPITAGSSPSLPHRNRSSSLSSNASSSSSYNRPSLPPTHSQYRLSCHETSV